MYAQRLTLTREHGPRMDVVVETSPDRLLCPLRLSARTRSRPATGLRHPPPRIARLRPGARGSAAAPPPLPPSIAVVADYLGR